MSEQEPTEKALSFSDWEEKYEEAESDSAEETEALEGMVSVASTYVHWDKLWWLAPRGSELEARAEEEMKKFEN